MNRFILNAMNHENLTTYQLECNFSAAADAADAAYAYTNADAADAAYAYARIAYAYAAAYTGYWLNEYFMQTGESRPDYEAELERDNSFREVS